MAMQGIDIASYQSGIDLSSVPCDFVIIKATQGKGYVNPDCNRAYEQAKSAGKYLGIYHYIDGSDAVGEANHFVDSCSNWVGEAMFCLDWEAEQNAQWRNEGYLAQVIEQVINRTGTPPMVYTMQSRYDEVKAVTDAYNCGLWIAQYATMEETGYQDTPWNEGAYGCAIRQYSSNGRLDGWNGGLDLDKFYGDGTAWQAYAGAKPAPFEPIEEVKVDGVAVYRLYNPNSGEHFWTANIDEANNIKKLGWRYEGLGWVAPKDGDPVYRLYNPVAGDHHYTASKNERDTLTGKYGWRYEGEAFCCSHETTDTPVYRLYNPNAWTGAHHFTVSANERDTLLGAGWRDEGVAFYAKSDE